MNAPVSAFTHRPVVRKSHDTQCRYLKIHSQFEELINVGRCTASVSTLALEFRLLNGLHLIALRDVHSGPRSVADRKKSRASPRGRKRLTHFLTTRTVGR